ncbi:MAG: hypothetical protein J5772_04920 [Clostridia bacterium]|nr:hypothetical protein [Clostridia bacterium]
MKTITALKKYILSTIKKHRFLAKTAAKLYYYYTRIKKTYGRFCNYFYIYSRSGNTDPKYMRRQIVDMIFSRWHYNIIYREFYLFNFEDLTDSGRKKYMGALESKAYFRALNSTGAPKIIDDKQLTYNKFKEFFKRDVLIVESPSQKEDFLLFVNKHPHCVFKPLNKYGGKGVKLLDIPDAASAEEAFDENIPNQPFILEEFIVQDPAISEFYPGSVNTIRYTTFFYEGELTRLQAVLRMGCGGSFVDNATSGGLYVLIDTESGVILGDGRNFKGERFKCHPDTGKRFIGSCIPRWSELNQLLEKIVRVLPEQKQVGWDFALTTDGWALVEANTGPAIQGFDPEHGLRSLFCDTIGKAIPVKKY